jgi:hypothetical protein
MAGIPAQYLLILYDGIEISLLGKIIVARFQMVFNKAFALFGSYLPD